MRLIVNCRYSIAAVVVVVLLSHGCTATHRHVGDLTPSDNANCDLRVLSFNIRYGTAKDGDNRWANRRELAFDVIRRHAPDIAGLQEALDWQLDESIAALPHFAYVGVGRDDGVRAGEFAAILYRRDRFTVADQGTFWFSDHPAKPGSMSWGNLIPRICTWARFTPKSGDRAFYVYNVHLDHASQHSRERSAEFLTTRIRARAHRDPIIVTGDFNAGETNPAILRLTTGQPGGSLNLVDTFRVLYPDETTVGTFNAFRGAGDGEKIDYIFAPGDAKVFEAAIIRDHDGARYPSDHYPVIAALRLP